MKESIWTVSSSINKHATIAGGIRNANYHQQKMGNFNKKNEKSTKKFHLLVLLRSKKEMQSIINKKMKHQQKEMQSICIVK